MIDAGKAVRTVAGLGAPSIVAACALATAAAYRGRAGEPYSPLNHWISELGEEGVSSLAPVFNTGVIVGGTCFAVFMSALAGGRGGRLARVYGTAGVVAGVAGALVGAFPMNRIVPHAITSTTFFNVGTLAIALASLDFVARPDGRFGRAQAGIGVLTTAIFAAFSVVGASAIEERGLAALEAPVDRREVMALMTLEWATLLAIMAWTLATANAWARAVR